MCVLLLGMFPNLEVQTVWDVKNSFCLAIQRSHAITSEWRINVFRTPGAKAVTVWSPRIISD